MNNQSDQTLRALSNSYATANNRRSWFELMVTIAGYGISVWLLYVAYITQSWLLYVPVCLVGALFMVKIFCLLHDCSHGSMFTNGTTNTWVGRFLSLFITMPFTSWKTEHDDHHGHVVDMERMQYGDIPLMTVEQYKAASFWKRLGYQVFRQPIFFLLAAPFLYFFVKARFPHIWTKEVVASVMLTNIFVAAIYLPLFYVFGFWTMVFVFMPAAYFGGMIGVTLFYLQHNYPGVEWYQTAEWEHEHASLHGSSLIRLPRILEWFSHAIGYHHIHHLNSTIPGYRLRKCFDEVPDLRVVTPLTFSDMVAAFKLKLWSYQANALVTISESAQLHR